VHPNIVQVFDFGLDEEFHQHFIVMEHVDGQSCAELLRDRGHLDVDQAVEIVAQACRGLDYAHRNGVVHRDVKPGNLLVSKTDVVKLADFGIARATDQSSITQVGSVLGTAAYLAPEQARGEEAGPRADMYSLGVVAYQLLSGRLPYEATSLSELALKQQRESPVPLQQLNPRVPVELADAVLMALAIDQEARPATAQLLAEAIQDGARGVPPFHAETPTRHLGTSAATRVLGRESPTEATRVAAAATARVPPRPAPQRARTTTPPRRAAGYETRSRRQPPARERSAARRSLTLFMLLSVLIVVVVIVILVATSTSPSVVHYRTVVANDAQTAINDVRGIISHYTK